MRLAEQIWDSVAEIPESVPLTPEQKNEIERRLDAYRQDPAQGCGWAEVKARILAR